MCFPDQKGPCDRYDGKLMCMVRLPFPRSHFPKRTDFLSSTINHCCETLFVCESVFDFQCISLLFLLFKFVLLFFGSLYFSKVDVLFLFPLFIEFPGLFLLSPCSYFDFHTPLTFFMLDTCFQSNTETQ